MRLSLCLTTTLVGLGLLAGAVDRAPAHVRITTDISWGADVRPILRKHCMGCHHAGGIAPDYVDLTTYGSDRQPGARAWATAIEEEILTGRMPPWQADPRFGSFRNGRLMTREEIETVVAWVRGGGPQGPRRNLPPPPEYAGHDWILGAPDVEVTAAEEFVLAAGEPKGSITFEIPLEIEEDGWITGFEFLPQNPEVVYRMQAWLHDPEDLPEHTIEMEVQKEYDPFADEDELEETRSRVMPRGPHFLGQWVRGDEPVLLPDEAGRKLYRGATVELRIDYERQEFSDPGQEIRDRSRLGLFLGQEEVDLLVESKQLLVDESVIKPGKRRSVQASWVMEENVQLIGINPRVGSACQELEVRTVYPDGKVVTLLWIPEYDPKWASSFLFEEPVTAPAGTRVEMVGLFQNSRAERPAKLRVGGHRGDQPFEVVVDYMLEDHLQVAAPEPLPRPTPQNRGGGMLAVGDLLGDSGPGKGDGLDKVAEFLGDVRREDSGEIYWCPMRGNPCQIHDFHEPGQCPECGMNLRLKSSFFKDKEVAAASSPWALTSDGRFEVYWCPNRGGDDHQLSDHPGPGRCPVCQEKLLHRSRFDFVSTYRCLTPECPRQERAQTFYSSGLCPHCGQPVQSMGHMDHTPVHGSNQFFMADNLYHHLEGTLSAPGEFHLYVYDDWKRPLDPRNFAGKVVFEHFDSESGEYSEEEYPLSHPKSGDEHLVAAIPKELPAEFYALVWLAGVEKRYDFYFEALTREPPPDLVPQDAALRLHSHERVTPEIPVRAVDVVREILKRQARLEGLIEAEDWFGLHNPAFDAKDLAEELLGKLDGLSARQRGEVKRAVSRTLQGALDLDRAGDAADEPRVRLAFDRFREGTSAFVKVFPESVR